MPELCRDQRPECCGSSLQRGGDGDKTAWRMDKGEVLAPQEVPSSRAEQ